jgi:DNA-binding MarR family transcriptional regulator
MSDEPTLDPHFYEAFLKSLQSFQRLNGRSVWTLLSKSRFMALNIIKKESDREKDADGVSVSSISQHMHSSMPATSRILGGLEKRGLILRTADSRDRRNTLVTLTPEGVALHDEAKSRLLEYIALVIEAYGVQRAESLMMELGDLGDTMTASLETMRENYPELRDIARPPMHPFVCEDIEREAEASDKTPSDSEE